MQEKRIIEIEKEEKANQEAIEVTENRYKTAQEQEEASRTTITL